MDFWAIMNEYSKLTDYQKDVFHHRRNKYPSHPSEFALRFAEAS